MRRAGSSKAWWSTAAHTRLHPLPSPTLTALQMEETAQKTHSGLRAIKQMEGGGEDEAEGNIRRQHWIT